MMQVEAKTTRSLSLFMGETALVTGAGSNIGRAIALRLATEGAHVLLTDISEQNLAATASAIRSAGGASTTIVADLSTVDGWRELDTEAARHPVAMFVHSACPRRHEIDTVLAVEEATFDAMLTTNVRSGFLVARALARRMIEARIPGRMLFITSLHAQTPRNLPHYSASKAGMTMLVAELSRALGPHAIRVNALAPGAVPGGGAANMDDSFGVTEKIALQRFATADDMAGPAIALLSNDLMGYVTGATLAVDGGLQHFNWIPMPQTAARS